jgi:hypothetical protein
VRLLLMLKGALCAAVMLSFGPSVTARAENAGEDTYCGMLPPRVDESALYAGWSACTIRKWGEKPLWQGLPKRTNQFIRFTFTPGHSQFIRVVTIRERDDGTAVLTVFGTRSRLHYRDPVQHIRTRRVQLSAAQMDEIDKLAADAGVWDFDIGTWDQIAGENGDEMEIYLHCQLLEMERANAEGYRFSSVNIGCNQPRKLMPFVNEIVRLGRIRNTHNGMLFE